MALIPYAATASVLAVTFLLVRPLALIIGACGVLLALFRFANALAVCDWPLLLRDALCTFVCALVFWALLILTQ